MKMELREIEICVCCVLMMMVMGWMGESRIARWRRAVVGMRIVRVKECDVELWSRAS